MKVSKGIVRLGSGQCFCVDVQRLQVYYNLLSSTGWPVLVGDDGKGSPSSPRARYVHQILSWYIIYYFHTDYTDYTELAKEKQEPNNVVLDGRSGRIPPQQVSYSRHCSKKVVPVHHNLLEKRETIIFFKLFGLKDDFTVTVKTLSVLLVSQVGA